MDVNKLMIGDWVYEIPYNNQSAKNVTTVDIGILHGHEATFFKEDYEPIPITDEILNLNFKTQSQPDIWNLVPGSENYIFNDDGKYLLNICDEDYNYIIDHFPIRYVHELQHFLRLCGLNDIADNFKV